MCGEPGGMNLHSNCLSQCLASVESWADWSNFLNSRRSSRFAPTQLVPLSEYSFFGHPLLEMKREKASRNITVYKSVVASRCTALMLKGPQKSTPAIANGLVSVSPSCGVGVAHYLLLCLLSLQHTRLAASHYFPNQIFHFYHPVLGPDGSQHKIIPSMFSLLVN